MYEWGLSEPWEWFFVATAHNASSFAPYSLKYRVASSANIPGAVRPLASTGWPRFTAWATRLPRDGTSRIFSAPTARTRSYSPEATASEALRTASMPVAQYAATRVTGIGKRFSGSDTNVPELPSNP